MLTSLLLLVSLSTTGELTTSKGYYPLADQVDDSTFICIGRVEEILVIPTPAHLSDDRALRRGSLPIARVTVERVLKGAKDVAVVYHEAWGTWTCDTTTAEVGQRALFLLRRGGEVQRAPEVVQEAVYAALGSDFLHRNVGSGDGIQPIHRDDGKDLVRCVGAPDVLDHERVRYAQSLADVTAYIEELDRFALDAVSVHALSGYASLSSKDSGSFDLRIRPDGQARLATSLGCAEQVKTFELDSNAWRSMGHELERLIAGQKRIVGDPGNRHLVRELTLRTRLGSLSYAEPSDWSPAANWTSDQRFALVDALDAWAYVRSHIDCLQCDDHTEKDRIWLQNLR